MQKKIILSIVMIIVVLVIVFLSQQTYSKKIGKNLISAATSQISTYLAKGSIPGLTGISSKINDQIQNIQSGGATIQNGIDQTKQKISDTEKNIQNYFSGVANSLAGKNSCVTQPTTTSSGQ